MKVYLVYDLTVFPDGTTDFEVLGVYRSKPKAEKVRHKKAGDLLPYDKKNPPPIIERYEYDKTYDVIEAELIW